jgi:hypothetical protein
VTVVVNDAALNLFLRDRNGPVGIDLARRARQVEEAARLNASGAILGIRSGDLIAGLRTDVRDTNLGLEAVVGTTAIHRGFGYPAYLDQRGHPWLTEALRSALL